MNMTTVRRFLLAGLCAMPLLAQAGPRPGMPAKPVERFSDDATATSHLRKLGFRAHGNVDRHTAAAVASQGRTFPTFSSSFTVGGQAYPFTMVGYPPASGRSAHLKSVIIPLRMNFSFFGPNFDVGYSFEPAPAVASIVASPLYQPATYPDAAGLHGQFLDQMQRVAFWNQMDREREWHVLMQAPVVMPTVDIEVTPETGSLAQLPDGSYVGDVLFDFMDSQINTILQFMGLEADTLPIFVTDMVTNEALGYHSASTITDQHGATGVQTYIFTSWLDPAEVDPLLADVSTFNHELAEWANDPFVNNVVPVWAYPPASDPRTVCSANPFLEVGDPQGNGPTFDDYPTAEVTIGAVTYHLQQLVLWEWFTDRTPSGAYKGWYSFPIPDSLPAPAVYCP